MELRRLNWVASVTSSLGAAPSELGWNGKISVLKMLCDLFLAKGVPDEES